jgi:uncharacterized integral membrane protein
MPRKILFFTVVIVLFLAVLFLDQNSAPVPLKIILGEPRPVGLSAIILTSMLVGVLLALTGVFVFKSVRKPKNNQQEIE